MRPIKFRAWTGKRMFYQAQQYLNSFIRRAVHYIIFDSGDTESEKEHESYLPNGGDIDQYLTQFTGLLDKNGKEIYEGDVVKLENTDICIIEYQETRFVAIPQHPKFNIKEYIYFRTAEVIGNIYENPELINAK